MLVYLLMSTITLLKRNLIYYWRTNLAVVLGVSTAVAVLTGALLVGDSVRGSLRDLVLLRLGKTDHVITASGYFREQLAEDLQSHEQFPVEFQATCPLIIQEGSVTHQDSGRRASRIQVYGVDDRFWRFNRQDSDQTPREREILLSPSLVRELGSQAGDWLLLRVVKPSAIPTESLHGRKDDLAQTIRLTAREMRKDLGEFSLQPRQGEVRAAFVHLRRLQKELEQEGKVNTVLLSEREHGSNSSGNGTSARIELAERLLRDTFSLEDLGIKLRILEAGPCLSLETESALISDALAETARTTAAGLKWRTSSILTYLANVIRCGQREIPYSLVTAVDPESYKQVQQEVLPGKLATEVPENASNLPPILLNDWAARDLRVSPGAVLSVEYYLWEQEGRLTTKIAQFQTEGVVAIRGATADRELAPEYPGITESENLSDWDPPFPMDLGRIRPQDEDYWHKYRTIPKAFIPLQKGQELWQSRFGKLSSLRLIPSGETNIQEGLETYQRKLRASLDPMRAAFSVYPARSQSLQASHGATDFGEYFLYFSFFLVVSALILAGLFFKLGVEQRLKEIGLLQAMGFPASRIRGLFLSEGLVLAGLGSLLGLAGALSYGALMMLGLRTWWQDAVGTTDLHLHISGASLVFGGAGGVLMALGCVIWTLRTLDPASPRSLLAGSWEREVRTRSEKVAAGEPDIDGGANGRFALRFPLLSIFRLPLHLHTFTWACIFGLLGILLLLAASLGWIGQAAGFFGAGTLLLAALLCYQLACLRQNRRRLLQGNGWWAVCRIGLRNGTYRAGRSVLCIALIASATFIIVAVEAFRREAAGNLTSTRSGTGGYPLLAESLFPLHYDLNTPKGKEALNLGLPGDSALESVTFARFRLRPGDDASCLNLYQPGNPRILAPTADFVKRGRFAFQASLASSAGEKENPWLLLNKETGNNTIPVIADANSLTYSLHLKIGDELVLHSGGGEPLRLRVVAALADSLFQSELLMSEKNFLRHFPDQDGYSFFLLDLAPEHSTAITVLLEDRLSDFGFDVIPTAERLAGFHRVENTYLSTFQSLGGLGLILGTFGLATVLLRNILERRRELALLRAVGYTRAHLTAIVIAENVLLLVCGLITGTVCAILAIAPAYWERDSQLPFLPIALLLFAVLLTGLTASLLATRAALRSPLLPALRAE